MLSDPSSPRAPFDPRLDELARESAGATGLFLGVLFTGYLAFNAVEFPEESRAPLLLHDAALVVLGLGTWLYSRRHALPAPSYWLAILGLAVVSNITLAAHLRQVAFYDNYLQLTIIVAGTLILSLPAHAIFLIGTIGLWASQMDGAVASPQPLHRSMVMAAATAVSLALSLLRMRWATRLEAARRREVSQREELEQALEAARGEIRERQRVERMLRASEDRFIDLFDRLLESVVIFEPVDDGRDFVFAALNRAGPGLDTSELLGRRLSETLPQVLDGPAGSHLVEAAREGGEATARAYEIVWRERTYFLDYRTFRLPSGEVVAVFRDRTNEVVAAREREEIRDKLLSAQKLESLGVLAGGVAHDFNNLLMGVLANADAASSRLDDGEFVEACLADVRLASKRASALCRQLLDYSGQSQVSSRDLDLGEMLEEIGSLLETAATGGTRLQRVLQAGGLTVNGDSERLKQVVVNLVSNAAEASASSIRVRTEQRYLDSETLGRSHLGAELLPGDYALIIVEDDGEGIPVEDQTRVFDPFFSTRFTGRGLGLSAVVGIVRAHQGALFFESEPGTGTTMSVAFPLIPSSEKPSAPHDPSDSTDASRSVLLVDDDATTRRSVRRLLELDACQITEACNGDEALECASESTFDVVLLDLTMPTRGGVETFPELAAKLPKAKIVLMSGYDASADGVGGITDHPSFGGFLSKPYTLASLREAVSKSR